MLNVDLNGNKMKVAISVTNGPEEVPTNQSRRQRPMRNTLLQTCCFAIASSLVHMKVARGGV